MCEKNLDVCLLVAGCNPVYNPNGGWTLITSMTSLPLYVSIKSIESWYINIAYQHPVDTLVGRRALMTIVIIIITMIIIIIITTALPAHACDQHNKFKVNQIVGMIILTFCFRVQNNGKWTCDDLKMLLK